jgi:hypothetical protein
MAQDRNLIQRRIQMTKPQSDWLIEKATSLGISVPELVRRILDDYRGESLSRKESK